MQRSTVNGGSSQHGLQGRHVLAIILGFFGSIFSVNGYFIVRALTTHSGVVAEEPYRKGLGYNQRIAANDRQTALNWRADLDIKATGTITLTLHDAADQPIGNQHVAVTLGRPTTRAFDRTLALTETAPGIYAGTTRELAAGTWIADADIQDRRQDLDYRIRRRLWLTP